MDVIRRQVEPCNCPQGFQLMHSLGGGAGGGLGSLILPKIRDNYPDRLISTCSVFPSPKQSDVEVEPYNAILSIHRLLEYSDVTHVLDNAALYAIAQNVLRIKEPTYSDLNWIISQAMADVTATIR